MTGHRCKCLRRPRCSDSSDAFTHCHSGPCLRSRIAYLPARTLPHCRSRSRDARTGAPLRRLPGVARGLTPIEQGRCVDVLTDDAQICSHGANIARGGTSSMRSRALWANASSCFRCEDFPLLNAGLGPEFRPLTCRPSATWRRERRRARASSRSKRSTRTRSCWYRPGRCRSSRRARPG